MTARAVKVTQKPASGRLHSQAPLLSYVSAKCSEISLKEIRLMIEDAKVECAFVDFDFKRFLGRISSAYCNQEKDYYQIKSMERSFRLYYGEVSSENLKDLVDTFGFRAIANRVVLKTSVGRYYLFEEKKEFTHPPPSGNPEHSANK